MGLVCGVKLTHDAGVALFDGWNLITCHEREKWGNEQRYAEINHLGFICDVLEQENISTHKLEELVLDGWYDAGLPLRRVNPEGDAVDIMVNSYGDEQTGWDRGEFFAVRLGVGLPNGYWSYTHVAGHVAAAYSSSPFARRSEDAYVIMWDGGTVPQVYHVEFGSRRPRFVANAGVVLGNLYNVFPMYLEPFRVPDEQLRRREIDRRNLSIPGKAMALAGYGRVTDEHRNLLSELLASIRGPVGWDSAFQLTEDFLGSAEQPVDAADAIAALDVVLGEHFVTSLAAVIRNDQSSYRKQVPVNVCLIGGCALNIRWNASVRELEGIREVWVPPFANDSGSSIGAALTRLWDRDGARAMTWDVSSGPPLVLSRATPGWRQRTATPEDVGSLLHRSGEAVVVLSGRAELGPRALGNRSVLAPAHSKSKEALNRVKQREWYRPVAPMCLEEEAPAIFEPGTPDQFMLFNHTVRPSWTVRVPAIVHADGTARLQTVPKSGNSTLRRMLESYYRQSGVPVLCNTSANFSGSGFFPSAESAMKWGGTRFVWADGMLYEQEHCE